MNYSNCLHFPHCADNVSVIRLWSNYSGTCPVCGTDMHPIPLNRGNLSCCYCLVASFSSPMNLFSCSGFMKFDLPQCTATVSLSAQTSKQMELKLSVINSSIFYNIKSNLEPYHLAFATMDLVDHTKLYACCPLVVCQK